MPLDARRNCQLPLLVFVLVTAALTGCSPYVYKEEISNFQTGVSDSAETFEELKKQRRRQLIAERNTNLASDSVPVGFTTECDDLRIKYEVGFAETATNTLTKADYQACQIKPAGRPHVDPILPNLTALNVALARYAESLVAITDADDVDTLQAAFAKFNSSTEDLVTALNDEMDERGKQKYDLIADLVYRAGVAYLNRRRFNALKQAVNDTDEVVARSADLLAEAAFSIYGPAISKKYEKLTELRFESGGKTGSDYLSVWKAAKDAQEDYVRVFADSPVNAFQGLRDSHHELLISINDVTNTKQREAVIDSLREFRDAAKKARDLLQDDDEAATS